MKHLLVIMIVLVTGKTVLAQDPLFTQFWYSPVYLNPAFTGCGKNKFQACVNSRVQWVNLPAPLQSYTGSAGYFIQDLQGSVGIMANRFNEGYLRTTQAYLLFAKSFGSTTDDCRDWFVNVAFQGGYGWYNANRDRLLFPDQINENGPTGQPSQFEAFKNAGKSRLDMSVGMLFCFKNLMGGAAWHHINETPYSFAGSSEESRLQRRYTFHLSYTSLLTGDDAFNYNLFIKPTVIYNMQGISNSLVVGTLLEWPNSRWSAGVWYKNNLGGGNNLGITDNHTLSVNVTFRFGPDTDDGYNNDASRRFNLGFSGEGELNRPGARYTFGSTEGGLLYESGAETCPYDKCKDVRYPWMYF